MSNRILQLDFLKGILIINVIMIHLIYLGECHPDFKRFLLLFTTPSFLSSPATLPMSTSLLAFLEEGVLVARTLHHHGGCLHRDGIPLAHQGAYRPTFACGFPRPPVSVTTRSLLVHSRPHRVLCGLLSLHKALTAKRLWLIIPYIIIMIILALSVPKYTSLQSVLFFSAGIIIKHSTDNFVKFSILHG